MAENTFISLVPLLPRGAGHEFSYHTSLSGAFADLGIEHIVAVPKGHPHSDLPANWRRCLNMLYADPHSSFIKKAVYKSVNIFLLSGSLRHLWRDDLEHRQGTVILFIESFTVSVLCALLFLLLSPAARNVHFFILYRYSPAQMKWRKHFYRFFNKIMTRRLGDARFRIITDSDLLAKSQTRFFRQKSVLVPVPHMDIRYGRPFPKQNGEIILWWPGPPRPAKGWDVVKRLATSTEESASRFKLVAAKSSGIKAVPGGVQVELVEDHLSLADYKRWLATCDVVLLPYDAAVYGESTSGIFIEVISAGKLPIVSPGTWMAYELEKFGLAELVVNWDNAGLAAFIWQMHSLKRTELIGKLGDLRRHYLTFHNEKRFAEIVGRLVQTEGIADLPRVPDRPGAYFYQTAIFTWIVFSLLYFISINSKFFFMLRSWLDATHFFGAGK